MNGPEHYREAERLLELAKFPRRIITGLDPTQEDVERVTEHFGKGTVVFAEGVEIHDTAVAAAQVHATLALAAATALSPGDSPQGDKEWIEVAS